MTILRFFFPRWFSRLGSTHARVTTQSHVRLVEVPFDWERD